MRTLKKEVGCDVVREYSHWLMLISSKLLDVTSWKEKKTWERARLLCLIIGSFNPSLGSSSRCDHHDVGPPTFSPLCKRDADMVILGSIGRCEQNLEDDGNSVGE